MAPLKGRVRHGQVVVEANRRIPLLLVTLAVIAASVAARADYSDCRTCHYATVIDASAPDYTGYFVDPGHHPVRVSYPVTAEYNQPAGIDTDILFFDRNGNGIPDLDEVQIFNSALTTSATTTTTRSKGTKGGPKNTATTTWVIDCASCHTEHGTTAPDPTHPADYVRNAGGDQWLCITCHRL